MRKNHTETTTTTTTRNPSHLMLLIFQCISPTPSDGSDIHLFFFRKKKVKYMIICIFYVCQRNLIETTWYEIWNQLNECFSFVSSAYNDASFHMHSMSGGIQSQQQHGLMSHNVAPLVMVMKNSFFFRNDVVMNLSGSEFSTQFQVALSWWW